jgi:hypothetical protein
MAQIAEAFFLDAPALMANMAMVLGGTSSAGKVAAQIQSATRRTDMRLSLTCRSSTVISTRRTTRTFAGKRLS